MSQRQLEGTTMQLQHTQYENEQFVFDIDQLQLDIQAKSKVLSHSAWLPPNLILPREGNRENTADESIAREISNRRDRANTKEAGDDCRAK